MIRIFQQSAYRHGYLFITAAWLYTLSFLFTNYFSVNSSPDKVANALQQYIYTQENYFNDLVDDSAKLGKLLSEGPNDLKQSLNSAATGIFTWEVNDIGNGVELYWNNNTMTVEQNSLKKKDGSYAFVGQNGFFEMIKRTVKLHGHTYFIVGMIPIYWEYKIEDELVKNGFATSSDLEKNYYLSADKIGVPLRGASKEQLFYVVQKDQSSLDQPGTTSILLRVAAIILLMIFVNSLAADVASQYGFFPGFILLTIIVVIVRTITYIIPFPFDYSEFELFDPGVYASSSIHPSLGDLMINSVLVFWLVTFLKFNFHRIKNNEFFLKGNRGKIIAVAALCFMPLFTITMANFLTSLVNDSSKIYFDVTYLFSLNIYTIVSFVIICILMLTLFYCLQLLHKLSSILNIGIYWRIVIMLSFALILLFVKAADSNNTLINFSIIAWLVVVYIFSDIRKSDAPLSFYNSSWFMIWSVFLMASVAAFLIYQNNSLERDKRKRIAEALTMKFEDANQKILSVTSSKFNSFFSDYNFRRFFNESDNKRLKSSIINSNFVGYLNNFNSKIYTYDFNKLPLFNEDSTSWYVINSILVNKSLSTTIPNLYYYDNSADKFSYVYEKKIYSKDSALLGYAYLIIQPRSSKENSLSPQIFKQLTNDKPLIAEDYAYAIYNNNHLIRSTSNYSFSDSIPMKQLPDKEFTYKDTKGYTELWYNAPGDYMIIVAKKDNWFTEAVTFFAYLFGLFIILVLIQYFGQLIVRTHFRMEEMKKIFRFNIRTQIQTIIVVVSVISFIVIGIATISFFIVRFKNNNEEMLRNTAQVIQNEIEQLTGRNFVASDIGNLKNIDLNYELEQRIVEIAQAHNTNINFFDVDGNLQISSQQYIYDNGIISRSMNPAAYYDMRFNHKTQLIQEEKLGNSQYLNIYVPVKNQDGSTLAFVNIPYLNPEQDLSQEISNFLITLINLNALIFILAGAIAIWITSRITSSFTLIGNKMKAISFGDANEEIEWKKNDELGELVSEYNKMVKKLAESAKALARSEREGAWREMARQVAHEIKNPLTPMKLSIQYLQKAIDNNSPNVKSLSKQVAETLVEQIDQLSKIAGDFSQFANIANVNKELFDLSSVIDILVRLFSADERVCINLLKANDDATYMIEADRMQMNRLFTNLIKNAIEAYNEEEKAIINIRQSIKDNEVIVSVQDEASGIPNAMQPKIFAPNFTTKSSGTGLGLAICKGIVEKANGNIWFETQENIGTTFHISLPLAKK